MTMAHRGDGRIGTILYESGKITKEDIERIIELQRIQNIRFGEAAQQLGLITNDDIQQVLAQQFEYPYLLNGIHHLSEELVAGYMPFSPLAEALRAVRSHLMLRWFGSQSKCLSLVAPNSGAGNTYVAANLAIIFSQLGERTLLIDANLRQPRQHTLFNLSSRQGLTDIISGRASVEVVERISAFLDLSVLGAGTLAPNPQELLGRPGFEHTLNRLSEEYDVILVDSPPSASSADVQTIAARCKGAMVVVRPHHTKLSDGIALRELIASAGSQVVGAIMNRF